jgi:hypothetical protein
MNVTVILPITASAVTFAPLAGAAYYGGYFVTGTIFVGWDGAFQRAAGHTRRGIDRLV